MYSPGAGIFVKPGVKIALGSTSIEIFDKVNGIGATSLQKSGAKQDDPPISISPVTNQVQIDLNWKF
jgi:hypothetical protein